jgi:hypothetical protein
MVHHIIIPLNMCLVTVAAASPPDGKCIITSSPWHLYIWGFALLDERKCLGLRSPCSRSLPLPFSLGDALADEEVKALAKGSSFPLVSLIGDGLCSHGSRLSTVLHHLQRTCAAFLLVLHAGLQSPQGLASEPGEEASAAEPQEDDSGGRRLPCLSGASETSSLLVKEALAMCSLPLTFEGSALVKKTLSCASGLLAGSLLLASTSGVLVEEPLVVGSLVLAGASGLLDEECLVLITPQIDDGRLPIPVGAVSVSASPMKNGPPTWLRRQQSGSLLVFADGSLVPVFVTKRSTNVGGGGCSVHSSRTTTRGRVGEAATIQIAATRKDRRGRKRANEPVGIHRSSFAEEEGGGGGPSSLVPT